MAGLKRYTQLPQLLHILQTRTITFLSPMIWDDKNDSYFIEKYKKDKGIKSVLALCMTNSAATYHHWHVFAGNISGVRIEFHEPAFREWANSIGADFQKVNYLKLDKADQNKIPLENLPFTKRFAFRDEGEVRLIVNEDIDLTAKSFPFDYSLIKEIVLSPWLPEELYTSVESAIRMVSQGATFNIRRTTMLANGKWQGAGQ
ncbi:MAG: hypothetical protein IT262_05065 [Saprospiraceae bacterium]|nr:hypothetical protein [Saprospiraceae bacterium]